MPVVSCPHCGRKIQLELHEFDTVIQCARCNGKFTARGGPVQEPEEVPWDDRASLPPPVRATARAEPPEPVPYLSYADDGPEPWYYRLIETYAKGALWSGIGSIAVVSLAFIVAGIRMFSPGPGMVILLILGTLVQAALAAFLLLLAVAFVLLIVDAARNLRKIRQGQSDLAESVARIERPTNP
jgi:hypothetical protein